MAEISTILWDVGGVLLTNGWDHQERAAVLKQFGVEKAEFEEFHPEANDEWEKGLITVDEYLNRTLFRKPRSFTAAEFLEAMKAQSQLLENTAFGILEQLAASESVDLGILNNEAAELNDYRIEQFGFRAYFDVFLSSCYVGLRKPGEQIYRLALNVLQAEPQEVVFIDDREGNVDVARSLGIHAFQYKGPSRLAQDLAALGIAIETN